MKINFKIKTCLTLFVIVVATSCTDNLKIEPISIITSSSFWKTPDDANGAIIGMYYQLRSVTATNYFLLGEARGETVKQGTIGTGGLEIFYNNVITPENMNSQQSNSGADGWTQLYTVVNSTNLILKYVPAIKFPSESAKNKILAQAYAMRAFSYFVLTRTFGDLVIRTEPTESSNADVTQKERSSQNEVFKLIKDDLDKAIQLFPDNTFSTGRNMWTKPATYALKADVYLWTGKVLAGGESDFNVALTALSEVQKADVSLLSNFADVFSYTNKGNKEILLSSRYQETEVGNNYWWMMWIISSSVPKNIDDTTSAIINPIGSGQGIMVPSTVYRMQNTTDDQRKSATYHDIYSYAGPNATGVRTYNVSIVRKGSGLVTGGTRYFINDIVLYRYADILLMIAEAKNALGQDPSAEINLVRKRAYGTAYNNHVFVNGTKVQNDAAILKERLLELAFEGKRWWDLVRFNKAFELVPSLQGRTVPILFPIPLNVLSYETKVKQNPGY